MTSSKSQNLQRSDWSISPPVTIHQQQLFNEKNQINIRSNTVYPKDDKKYSTKDQSKRTYNKQCKVLKWWSSIPPCVRGLLLGILTGSLILVIILPVWLIKKPAVQRNTAIAVLRWNTTGITVAGIVANPGNNNSQLNTPADVILDYMNNLYIADYLNHRIEKYLFGSSIGQTVAGNATQGSSQYQLNQPFRVIMDSNENLYISDTGNQRIQFWGNGAAYGTTVAGIGFCGNASNQLCSPYGLALNPASGTLYISDCSNQRIMSYASGANNGTLVFGGNGQGINNTQLDNPVGLHFDSFSNSLIVANTNSNNVVRYVLGANSWTLLAGDINGTSGMTATYFNLPVEAIFDPMGNLYVVDVNNERIQFFYNGQLNGTTVAGISGVSGSNATTLNFPLSVRLDSQLNLYVADANNHRIQKFCRY